MLSCVAFFATGLKLPPQLAGMGIRSAEIAVVALKIDDAG